MHSWGVFLFFSPSLIFPYDHLQPLLRAEFVYRVFYLNLPHVQAVSYTCSEQLPKIEDDIIEWQHVLTSLCMAKCITRCTCTLIFCHAETVEANRFLNLM